MNLENVVLSRSKQSLLLFLLLSPLLFLSMKATALTVPAGGQLDVDGGLLSLPCCDLIVEGTVTVTTGEIIVRNIIIAESGTLLLGTGTLTIGGELTNNGTLDDAAGTVTFINAEPAPPDQPEQPLQPQQIPALPPYLIAVLVLFIGCLAALFSRRREQLRLLTSA